MKTAFSLVVLENFKSYRGKHRLRIGEYGPGLHYIRGVNEKHPRLGPNGTGKSTIWDAVSWCLYGRTVSGLKNPDVTPWKGDKHVRVVLNVKRNKKMRKIVRTTKPNSLKIDGKDASQEAVIELIGMEFDVFANSVLFAQSQPLFFDKTPREKMELFTAALGLDKWDARAKEAASLSGSLQGDIAVRVGEITGLAASLDGINDMIAQSKKKADAWLQEREREKADAQSVLKKSSKELEKAQSKRDAADLANESAETERRHYAKLVVRLEEDLLDADRAHNAAKEKLNALRDKMRDKERELAPMENRTTCRVCGQSLKGSSLEKHKKRLKREIAELRAEYDRGIPKAVKNKVKNALDAIEQTRGFLNEFIEKANAARDDLERWTKRVTEISSEVKAARSVIESIDAQVNPHKSQLRTLRTKREETLDAMAELKKQNRRDERRAARATYWIKGFKDVRLYILDELMRELELATNALLEQAGLIGWYVSYSVEKETKSGTIKPGITIMIKSPESTGMVRWENWSGGEGQRLRIVGALALSEVLLARAGVKTNIEVLDEPTQHLSKEGVRDLCAFLADRARRLGKSVFYVDHASVESSHFASVTTITHDKHGSRIAGGGLR